MAEYEDLKNQMEELINSLKTVSEETENYLATTENLKDLSIALKYIAVKMSDVLDCSQEIYKSVNEISVQRSLARFNDSALKFENTAKGLFEEFDKKAQESNSKLYASFEKKLKEANDSFDIKFTIFLVVSIILGVLAVIFAII